MLLVKKLLGFFQHIISVQLLFFSCKLFVEEYNSALDSLFILAIVSASCVILVFLSFVFSESQVGEGL